MESQNSLPIHHQKMPFFVPANYDREFRLIPPDNFTIINPAVLGNLRCFKLHILRTVLWIWIPQKSGLHQPAKFIPGQD